MQIDFCATRDLRQRTFGTQSEQIAERDKCMLDKKRGVAALGGNVEMDRYGEYTAGNRHTRLADIEHQRRTCACDP